MNPLEKIIQNVSVRFQDRIQKFCRPLKDHFNVNHFSIVKISNSGNFSIISSHPDWMGYYFSENMHLKQPNFRHPRNFSSGIAFPKNIEDNDFKQIYQIACKKFNVNFAFTVINKVNDDVELFGFDVNNPHKHHDLIFINETHLLRSFITYFTSNNRDVLTHMADNQVNFNSILGDSFNLHFTSIPSTLPERELFLKQIGLNIPETLSKREKLVLKQVLEGYSAAKIAGNLQLSPRTIEHYLEKIKDKLSCFSKSELIQKARTLESHGFF